jgi:hypothetical protein
VEAFRLAAILPQLTSLRILDSAHAQVPYLFHSVIPEGQLPNLRSLTIDHYPSLSDHDDASSEWYNHEYESYEAFYQTQMWLEDVTPWIVVTDQGWMECIAKGAPHLEELLVSTYDVNWKDVSHSLSSSTQALRHPADHLCLTKLPGGFFLVAEFSARFMKLKRFFFEGTGKSLSDLHLDKAVEFRKLVEELAASCPCLEEVGDNSGDPYRGYVTVRISRSRDGNVKEEAAAIVVDVGVGYGMVVGQENRAFPECLS